MKLEPRYLAVLVLSLLLVMPRSSSAQLATDQTDAALQTLSSEAQTAVLQGAPALYHSSRSEGVNRLDRATGLRRAVYRARPLNASYRSAEAAARAYLEREHQSFGLSADLNELVRAGTRHSPAGSHITFQQVIHNLPVYHGTVKVNLDRSLQPTSVFNSTYAGLEDVPAGGTTPSISAQRARQRVEEAVSRTGAASDPPVLMIYPSRPSRLVWKVVAWPEDAAAEWVMLVDAHTGAFVAGFNSSTRLHTPTSGTVGRGGGSPELHSTASPPDSGKDAAVSTRAAPSSATAQVDGSGYVFDPDPVTTAGTSYGGAYVDDGDNSSEALDRERLLVPLPELAQNEDGVLLEGPFVRIVGRNPSWFPGSGLNATNYDPPIESSPDGFRYTRSENEFEAVNSYYHVDKSQRYLRSLGFENRPDQPIDVNPHGEGTADNSFYYPYDNLISLGRGGVDDAEDGSVIWHEYAHALLESADPAPPSLLEARFGAESRSLHEGWADYWAASYRRSLHASRSNLSPADYDWRELFPWDGHNEFWAGRRLHHAGSYPTSLTYDNSYRDGLLWAATLMDLFSELERLYGTLEARQITDRLNLQSHYHLPASPHNFSLRDAAHALLEADLQLYDGQFRFSLFEHLQNRGFIDPTAYGPQFTFDPRDDVEQTDGALRFEVQAAGQLFPVETVTVHYRRPTAANYQTLELSAQNDSLFVGTVTLSDQPGLVEYYLEAVDQANVRQRLPVDGPDHPFITTVGTVARTDLLAQPRASGGWYTENGAWHIDSTAASTSEQHTRPDAHLVLPPLFLSDNPDARIYLVLNHSYRMDAETAGNVQISTDNGRSWQTLSPRSGYPSDRVEVPPLQGRPAFTDTATTQQGTRTIFNLTPYSGAQVQMRISLGSRQSITNDIFWRIEAAALYEATFHQRINRTRTLELHPNFPDPFVTNTTIQFTLPSDGLVKLEMYDALGRRTAVISDRSYSAGTHTLTFSREGLANGLYFLQLTANGEQIIEPVRVIR